MKGYDDRVKNDWKRKGKLTDDKKYAELERKNRKNSYIFIKDKETS